MVVRANELAMESAVIPDSLCMDESTPDNKNNTSINEWATLCSHRLVQKLWEIWWEIIAVDYESYLLSMQYGIGYSKSLSWEAMNSWKSSIAL